MVGWAGAGGVSDSGRAGRAVSDGSDGKDLDSSGVVFTGGEATVPPPALEAVISWGVQSGGDPSSV